MNILKQSTAATIKLGPFVDDTDGKTAETALTIGQADIRLSKNGGDIAQSHNAAGATHDELGYYDIPLDTTDTGTLGRLRVLVSKAGALPVWQDFVVVTANVYDSMFSTDKLDVAVVEMATDVLTAAAVKADAVTKIQSGLATPTNITAGTITTVTNLTNLPTMPTDWVTAAGLKADAVSEIQSGLATAAALDAVDNFIDTEVAAILAAVDTEVAAIKAKTDNLPASPAAVGSAMTLTAAYDKAKDDVLTPLAVVDGIVDAIKAQTDKIPASPASAGEYTTNIGAIKAKTDNLPLSPASSGEYTSALTAIQNDLDNPNQYKADVSNLALQATSLAIKGQTDKIPAAPAQTGEYNAALTAIQADLDNPDQYKADVSGLATTAHVQEVENKIDAIDVTVNTIPTNPLLDTAYTAPDNAGIAAIKTKTDSLTFTTPNKVDASADVVLSPEAIEGMATAIRDGLPEDIWSSSKRTLTQSPAEIIATVFGADITQIRGNSWAVQLTGVELGSIQQLAIKHSAKQSDSAALLFVDSVNGLTILNGVTQDGEDSSKASLTYDGTILTLTVDASITAQLPAGSLKYGIQSISNNGIVSEPYGGTFRVLADIVRATD